MYGIVSDTHNHKWSIFSETLTTGVNSRLQIILDETLRAAKTIKAAGGDTLIHTGDVFHVRGSIAPSVLNPTKDLYRKIVDELGLDVYLLAGNHDLEGKNSTQIGNAANALSGVGVKVISNTYLDYDHKRLFVPYYDRCDEVRAQIDGAIGELVEAEQDHAQWTLFLHVPLNAVISGIPDHGFDARELASYGFKSVFTGHYHNFKQFDGNICSVGALTHQTFSDIGSKAGFLLVDDDATVTRYPSNAPRFVDFDTDWTEEEEIEQVVGNYVRCKLENASNEQIEEIRDYLGKLGAASVQVIHVPKPKSIREGASPIEAGATIAASISDWCKKQKMSKEVVLRAQRIIKDIEGRAE